MWLSKGCVLAGLYKVPSLHGEQDIAATACERYEGLVVLLVLTDLARVVGLEIGSRNAAKADGRSWRDDEMWPNDALGAGCICVSQAADAIARLGDMASQVIIEAAQHRELRDFIVGHFSERNVCGMQRAVSAMMYASRASVLASRARTSAIPRIASLGR